VAFGGGGSDRITGQRADSVFAGGGRVVYSEGLPARIVIYVPPARGARAAPSLR
jgi:hypothetical protein